MSDDTEYSVNWRPNRMSRFRMVADAVLTLGIVAILVAALLYVDSMRPY